MKIKILICIVFCSFLLLGAMCRKETPPKAVITVVDEAGVPVEGAEIKIFSDPSRYHGNQSGYGNVGYVNSDEHEIEFIKTSNDAGQATFDFKYECILNVSAKMGLARNDTIRGEGAIILKMKQTTKETITLRR